jgi:AcrR family transcriptional regulator
MEKSSHNREHHDEQKKLIIETSMKLLSEKGITKTSMNDIIRESGLSKGGVYHYFSSKNELLIEVWNYFFELYAYSNISRLQNDQELQKKPAVEQIDILIQYHETMLDSMGKDLSLMMDLFIEAIHNAELRKVFNQQYLIVSGITKALIDTAQKQGDIKPEIDSEVLSTALLAVFDGYGLVNQILDESEDIPRKALAAARLLLDGSRL